MFHLSISGTVVTTAVVLWFAIGWYLNERLSMVHAKLDSILDQLNGLREYLYEIDPQFDDERESSERFGAHMSDPNSSDIFAGMDDAELFKRKKDEGKRTLSTPFSSDP
ncbi:MAG TPA: hypothetical protein VFQ95_04875 [Rhodanobacteraceae bacterium]|nr:hypothetical protein [Rhodanobacteraceae bacterium]